MYELSRRSLVKLGAGLVAFGAMRVGEPIAEAAGSGTVLTDSQRATYAVLVVAVADAAREGESTLSTEDAVGRFATWYSADAGESRAAVDATLSELEDRAFARGSREERAAKLRGWRRAPCCSNDPDRTAASVRAAALASDAIGLASVPYADSGGKPVPAL
jgi:hypothetical protein